jgi:hypothetical protein
MKRWLPLLALPLLTACPWDKKKEAEVPQVPCHEIINPGRYMPPSSPILLDKCTGETWMMLRSDLPLEKGERTPGRTWKWYLIPKGYGENASAGQ